MRKPLTTLSASIALRAGAFGAALACAAWMSGCEPELANPLVTALRPLYTDADLEFTPQLNGAWCDENGDVKMVFEGNEQDRSYALTVIETGDGKEARGEFTAHLVRLGSSWLLDLYPNEMQSGDDLFKLHFLPTHTFAALELGDDQLKIAFLSEDWLKARIADKSVDTPHELADSWLLLTGSTRELQDFVDRYDDDSAAFSIDIELARNAEKKDN